MNSTEGEELKNQLDTDVYLKIKIYHCIYQMPFKQIRKLIRNLSLDTFNRVLKEIELEEKELGKLTQINYL
jgi:hypothetical protein